MKGATESLPNLQEYPSLEARKGPNNPESKTPVP